MEYGHTVARPQGRPLAAVSAFRRVTAHLGDQTAASAAFASIQLTGKGEAYCERHDAARTVARADVEAEIERLIAMLNLLDGDADYEPYLAGFEGVTDDREADRSDDEPSLGAPEIPPTASYFTLSHGLVVIRGTQEKWARGSGDDDESAEAEDPGGGDILDEPHL